VRRVYLGIRFVLSGNLGFLWGSYLFNYFFRDVIPKKGFFEFLNQFAYFNHQIRSLAYSTTHATFFWILFSKPWDLDARLEGLRDTCHQWLIFLILEDKDWKIQD
jgi:hypothetical protein